MASNPNRTRSSLIGIDPQTGILLLRSALNSQKLNESDSIELEVVASSSPTQFARATVFIEFSDSAPTFVNDLSQVNLVVFFLLSVEFSELSYIIFI